jgi:hypothetical protein
MQFHEQLLNMFDHGWGLDMYNPYGQTMQIDNIWPN